MTTTLPPIYVTAYPEFNSGGQYSPSVPALNSGQSFPRGLPNPVAVSLESRINNYAGPNYLETFQEVVKPFGWHLYAKIELKALAAADQMCAEGGDLSMVLNKIVRNLKACQQINENIIKYPTKGRVFSGGPLTALHALQHAIDGMGETVSFPINNIGLKVNLSQISDVMNAIHSANPIGKSTLDVKFPYNVTKDSVSSGLVLGNITLRVVGQVDKYASGSWSFNGVIRAFNGRYDANPSNHRNWLGETLTSTFGKVMRYEYTIEMPGEISVNMVGQ